MALDQKQLEGVRGMQALWSRLKPCERRAVEQLVENAREAAYLEGWDNGFFEGSVAEHD